MFKKILVSIFVLTIFVNAQEVEISMEDKYNQCSEVYDQCLSKCDEVITNIEECSSICEDNFYQCNEKVDQEEQNSLKTN